MWRSGWTIGAPGSRVGEQAGGGELEAGEVVAQAGEAGGVMLDCDDVGAGGGELGGLAAGGGAEIEHGIAGAGGEELGGERGRGVLHPERALGVAREVWDGGAGWETPRSGGEAGGVVGKLGGGFGGEVERGFGGVAGGDGAGIGAPARPEPGGGVEAGCVQRVEHGGAGLGDATEHGVHEAGERRQAAGAGERDGGGDGGMGGGVQQQQSGGTHAQDVAHLGWRGATQPGFQDGVERAEPAEHGGGQAVGGGAVTGWGVHLAEGGLERAVLVQHGLQDMQRGGAGGVCRRRRHAAVCGADRARRIGFGAATVGVCRAK